MRRLWRDSGGQVLVLLALMMVVLLGIAALALDVGMAYGIKAKMNAAVDAAAIAALRERTSPTGTEASANMVASNYFNANFPAESMGIRQPSCAVDVSTQNGSFVATVQATAVVPTLFARVIGWSGLTLSAKSEAIRSNLDAALVLDTSESLAGVWPTVRSQCKDFVSRFSEQNDRLALVPFALGVGLRDSSGELVLTDGVEISKSCTGFNKAIVNSKIDALSVKGYTATEFGMRMGLYQLNKVSKPAAHRAIVLFSDGAPNTFTGKFPIDASGTTAAGNLFSGTLESGPPTNLYHPDLTCDPSPQNISLFRIPQNGGGNSIGSVTLPLITVDNDKRKISSGDNLKCQANKAARNVLENLANSVRAQGVVIYTLGFGNMLDEPDITNDCSTYNESGSLIMRRLANTKDSDTYNPLQPSGLFCRAVTTADLSRCFDAIATAMMRLTK